MKELSKSVTRRLGDSKFIRKYFVGDGVDIGGKPDPLCLYNEIFPLMGKVKTWDLEDGDAQFMEGVSDNHYDFVNSSHCLEHLHNPVEGLKNWLRIIKPGGHIITLIPEEDLYEQGVYPSTFNTDHKSSFTLWKEKSWCGSSVNVLEMLTKLGPEAEVVKIEKLDATYRYDLPRYDQTLTPIGESAIEFVLRKRSKSELEKGGRLPVAKDVNNSELRLHFNQYRADQKTIRTANPDNPPFEDDSPI